MATGGRSWSESTVTFASAEDLAPSALVTSSLGKEGEGAHRVGKNELNHWYHRNMCVCGVCVCVCVLCVCMCEGDMVEVMSTCKENREAVMCRKL